MIEDPSMPSNQMRTYSPGLLGQQPSEKAIRAKLVKVGQQVGWIEKRGRNDAQKYDYVQAADVASEMREKLYAAGVQVTASVINTETNEFESSSGKKIRITGVAVNWTFHDTESGESITVCIPGEAMDAGDKAIYKAMTGSLKYALMLNFLLPTGDDPEKDDVAGDAVYKSQATTKAAPQRRAASPAATKPAPSTNGAAAPPPQRTETPADAGSKVPNGWGKLSGIPYSKLRIESLNWLIERMAERVEKHDEKWHDLNVRQLQEAETEKLNREGGAQEGPPGEEPPDSISFP